MILFKRVFFKSSFIAKMSQNVKRAQRVQENVELNKYAIQTQAKIRQRVTIESSIESIQKQMREQIARVLKNSEMKVIYFIKKAEDRLKEIENKKRSTHQVEEYNKLVDIAEKARWQFMVHRQACGFTIQNYQLVTSLYKIPPKLSQ